MRRVDAVLAVVLLAVSGPAAGKESGASDALLPPDMIAISGGAPGRLTVRVVVEQGRRALPVPHLAFSARVGGRDVTAVTDASGAASFDGCEEREALTAQADLSDPSFSIRPELTRRLRAQGRCGADMTLTFHRGNPAAGALRVWRVATLAKAALEADVGPAAWPRGVAFLLNDSAATAHDQVGVGSGDTTFVIGHELGHAVSDRAGMIQEGFGDSFHQMTGCIGDSAALEEGWATFFAAWVDQGPDAEAPYAEWDQGLAEKRRLPLDVVPDAIEVGPADKPQTAAVCVGTDNELRVTAFLWSAVSPRGARAPFATLWRALSGGHRTSVSQVALRLRDDGVDAAALRRAWAAAFKTVPCPL